MGDENCDGSTWKGVWRLEHGLEVTKRRKAKVGEGWRRKVEVLWYG